MDSPDTSRRRVALRLRRRTVVQRTSLRKRAGPPRGWLEVRPIASDQFNMLLSPKLPLILPAYQTP
jgi:hypothetical protein